jgi:ethanolamine utilization microcompartment shell protein EutL
MANSSVNEKHQAHELIERLAPSQVTAVVGLLEAMLDPVSRAIANASVDDEPETDQERQVVAESKDWFERRKGIPHEEVLADFGLTSDGLKKRKD